MTHLPPDLDRLGDLLERAVSRSLVRRQARMAFVRSAATVVAAVPFAVLAMQGHLSRPGPVPTVLAPAPAPWESSYVPGRAGARSDDRLSPAVAAGRLNPRGLSGTPHPRDHMPPPGGARAVRGLVRGVHSERVDAKPLPLGYRAGRPAVG